MVLPVTTELLSFFHYGHPQHTFLPNMTMLFLTILNVAFYWVIKNLRRSLLINSSIQMFCYCWGLALSGGLYSEQLVYITLFPLINGFIFGRRCVSYTILCLTGFCIYLFQNQSTAPEETRSLALLAYHLIGAATLSGIILFLFDKLRVKTEEKMRVIHAGLEREKARVQSREELFRNIFENSPVGIFRVDSKCCFTSANLTYENMLGYRLTELVGKTIVELIHPEDQPKIQGMLAKKLTSKNQPEKFELRFVHKRGHIIWSKITCRLIQERDGSVSILSTVEDVNDLKEQELESALIRETMADGLIIMDSNLNVIKCNAIALNIFGTTEEQLLTYNYQVGFGLKPIKEDGSDFDRSHYPAKIALETGLQINNTIIGLKSDSGDVKWIRLNATPYWSKSDSKTQRKVICTFSDITNIVAAEKENRFILDALGIGIWKFNPVTNQLFWDKSMFSLYEVNEADFSSHYDAWEKSLSVEAKAKATQELQEALRGEKKFDTKFEITTPKGNKKYISALGTVTRNKDGEAVFMYGINWDVTKEVLSEQSLESQRVLLDAVLNNLPNMVFVKDFNNEFRFKLFNKTGNELLGLADNQLIGKNDYDLFPKDQADFFTLKDKEVFLGKKTIRIDCEPINTPKGVRYLRTYKAPTYKADGTPDLLIGISTDITEELGMQKALELERAKSLHNAKLASMGEMSAGVAHEINNPLAIIMGNLMLLKRANQDKAKFEEKLEVLTKACNRIDKIVKGLKKFSRSSKGNVHQPASLAEIVNEALVMTEAKSKRHAVTINVDLDSKLMISCDAVEIEQVIINLITNGIDAIKDNSEKWMKILIFEEPDHIALRVIDSGLGIPEDVESKLFEPFFTTKPVGEGTGLGLSIAKGILDQHKATLKLNKTLGNTCFEIHFPKILGITNAA